MLPLIANKPVFSIATVIASVIAAGVVARFTSPRQTSLFVIVKPQGQ